MDFQYHVLAVDDSIIDRKLIERLLKTSSFQGNFIFYIEISEVLLFFVTNFVHFWLILSNLIWPRLLNFAVTAVDSPNKALEFLGLKGNQGNMEESLASKVNMIITDYSMPGMTGYELLRKIKESERLRDIPVVIMSSENIPARINRCLADGAEEFFLKPVQLSDVDKLKPHLLRSKVKDFCKFQQQRRLLTWYSDAKNLCQRCV